MRGKVRASSLCSPGLDALAPPPSSSLPFLPTLVTALALGGLGLLCRHPSVPEPAPAAMPALVLSAEAGSLGFEPSSTAAASAPLSGAVAFAQQFPLVADGQAVALRPARLAANARRGCTAGRCAEGKRAEPVRSIAQQRPAEPSTTAAIPREEDGRDAILPGEALPFMPTAAAMLDSVRSLGSRASAIGGSVIGSLAELN